MAAARARAPARSIGVAAAATLAHRVIVDPPAAEGAEVEVAAEAAVEEVEEGVDEPKV